MASRQSSETAELPVYLRRAPALIATGLSLLLGVAMLLTAAAVYGHHNFASGLLVNVGSTVVLFSPLALLSALFGQKIARSDIARQTQISDLSTEVAGVRRDVETVLADISEASLQRLSADRREVEREIGDIAQNPNGRSIARDKAWNREGLHIETRPARGHSRHYWFRQVDEHSRVG